MSPICGGDSSQQIKEIPDFLAEYHAGDGDLRVSFDAGAGNVTHLS